MKRAHAAIIAAALVNAGIGSAALAQKPVALVVADVKTVALGYRVSELRGKAVVNDRGEKIGTIDDFIINRDRVLFTVLSVGGFLGIGERLVIAPYSSLRWKGSRLILPGATKEALRSLPPFHYLK